MSVLVLSEFVVPTTILTTVGCAFEIILILSSTHVLQTHDVVGTKTYHGHHTA
jgi:hypothetical protein